MILSHLSFLSAEAKGPLFPRFWSHASLAKNLSYERTQERKSVYRKTTKLLAKWMDIHWGFLSFFLSFSFLLSFFLSFFLSFSLPPSLSFFLNSFPFFLSQAIWKKTERKKKGRNNLASLLLQRPKWKWKASLVNQGDWYCSFILFDRLSRWLAGWLADWLIYFYLAAWKVIFYSFPRLFVVVWSSACC